MFLYPVDESNKDNTPDKIGSVQFYTKLVIRNTVQFVIIFQSVVCNVPSVSWPS